MSKILRGLKKLLPSKSGIKYGFASFLDDMSIEMPKLVQSTAIVVVITILSMIAIFLWASYNQGFDLTKMKEMLYYMFGLY